MKALRKAGVAVAAIAMMSFMAACSESQDADSTTPPDPSSFRRVQLAGPFDEPVSLDVLDTGAVLVVERKGRALLWREGVGVSEIGTFENLFRSSRPGNSEFGLLAVAAAPGFRGTGFVYFMYNTASADDPTKPVQLVSRFHLDDDHLNMDSEVVLLEIPSDDNCCHTGGSIRFDANGLLYITTGDNTNPWSDGGYNPADNRPDRVGFDARRSAANTMDLRGKILRIRPTRDGGYTIPAGNLFSDPAEGRPEIYVMGARNPYTLAIDDETGVIYYGDVGPDGTEDSPTRGPRGYDEVNRVTQASNMGWPLFIANNQPYHVYDYETEVAGEAFDPAAPVNDSPRNTGARILPPAQPALIYWPYGASEQWPMLGEGGRNALVAGLYRRPRGAGDTVALPSYYDGKLIISDFMRRWMMAVTMTPEGGVEKVEPFAPGVSLAAPLDYDWGPDGALYVIEYGSRWFAANPDSALSRIEYTGAPSSTNVAANGVTAPEGHQQDAHAAARGLTEEYGCTSCHQETDASIGPAYRVVAERYADRADAQNYLRDKIGAGSAGVWGEQAMPAFDFVSVEDRTAIAAYILSLDDAPAE